MKGGGSITELGRALPPSRRRHERRDPTSALSRKDSPAWPSYRAIALAAEQALVATGAGGSDDANALREFGDDRGSESRPHKRAVRSSRPRRIRALALCGSEHRRGTWSASRAVAVVGRASGVAEARAPMPRGAWGAPGPGVRSVASWLGPGGRVGAAVEQAEILVARVGLGHVRRGAGAAVGVWC